MSNASHLKKNKYLKISSPRAMRDKISRRNNSFEAASTCFEFSSTTGRVYVLCGVNVSFDYAIKPLISSKVYPDGVYIIDLVKQGVN